MDVEAMTETGMEAGLRLGEGGASANILGWGRRGAGKMMNLVLYMHRLRQPVMGYLGEEPEYTGENRKLE